MIPGVLEIHGVVRRYAWGSPSLIPQLRGEEPDGRPVAELWFGAHEDDPSHAPDHGANLDELIAADPEATLGSSVAAEFAGRLPFLVKLLAAAKPLSIQVHPTRDQARAGFAAEEARGVPREAPQRNYRDTNHKPELLCALTPFEALCGFRPVEQTRALLDALDVAQLRPISALLGGSGGLRAAFEHLLTLADPTMLVAAVVQRCASVGPDHPAAGPASAVLRAADEFPGDIGAVLALLLNHVRLRPGEAIFLGAGNVHCYLNGLGVEVMANSDNVLRCGLTPKHVDVDEVLTLTDFTPLPDPRCARAERGDGEVRFEVPVRDFGLSVLDLSGARRSAHACGAGPHIVLCARGSMHVSTADADVRLGAGAAAFVRAGDGAFTVAGDGEAYLVGVGQPPDRQT